VAEPAPNEPVSGGEAIARDPRPVIALRAAQASDAEQIRTIYNYEVEHTTATFDLVPRSLSDQEVWLAARSGAFATVVAVDEATDTVLGFASLSPYKERAAYRTSVEDSVYVARSSHGLGIGRLLVTQALDVAASHGFHAVFARIEASGTASRRLHAACGFELVGVERQVGRKFGRWLDVAVMQCLLHERQPAGRPRP
jgi:L-amino acid N-acyltransferase